MVLSLDYQTFLSHPPNSLVRWECFLDIAYREPRNPPIAILSIGKPKNVPPFFYVRTICAHENRNRGGENSKVNRLPYNRSLSGLFFAISLYIYHPKRPNKTQKNRDLRSSPTGFRVGARTTTTDYRHKNILDASKGQVLEFPNLE